MIEERNDAVFSALLFFNNWIETHATLRVYMIGMVSIEVLLSRLFINNKGDSQ